MEELCSKQNLKHLIYSPSHSMDETEFVTQIQEDDSSEELGVHNVTSLGTMGHTIFRAQHPPFDFDAKPENPSSEELDR